MLCMVRFFAVVVKTKPRHMGFATLAAVSMEWI